MAAEGVDARGGDSGPAGEQAVLPLFPLGTVLMPGATLPLRIFEPRYRRLLADVTAEGARQAFGVVALTAGLEVDNGLDETAPQVAQVGTLAELIEVEQIVDGSFIVLGVGSRRFRIVRLLEAPVPYLTAKVEFLPERAGPMSDALPGSARALAAEYARLLALLAPSSDEDEAEPLPRDSIALSYRLAADSFLSPADRQQLLADDTATDRLERIVRVLRREVVLLRTTRSIAVSPSSLQTLLLPN